MGCTKTREQPKAVQMPTYGESTSHTGPGGSDRIPTNKTPQKARRWGQNRGAGAAPRPIKSKSGSMVLPSNRQPQTLNGDPEGPNKAEIQAVLSSGLGSMARCFAGTDEETAVLSFDAEPSGSARGIRVSGTTNEVADCVSAVVSGLRFPTFKGGAVTIDYPITVQRSKPTVAADRAEGESAPSEFVNP